MLRNLRSWLQSKISGSVEADPLDLADPTLRPYTVKTWLSVWCPLSLHTRCDNRTVHDLKSQGLKVYPFTAEGDPEDYIWVAPENVPSTVDLCRAPLYWMPWI